jgi:hypothetical protein
MDRNYWNNHLLGTSRLVARYPNGDELIWFSSDVYRLSFEHPFRVQYLSLAALGLHPPGSSRQPYPGFLTHHIARDTLHASTYNNEEIGTLARYSAEDRCGA